MPDQALTIVKSEPLPTLTVVKSEPVGAVSPAPDWIDKLTEWLPAAGGTVGGIVGTAGGPIGTIGGAALGGMAGEAYKELINRARGRSAPSTGADAAKDVGTQGAVQGGAEAAGAALGGVARAVAPRLMQSAIKPGLRTLVRGAGEDMQPVVKTMLDEGVNVSPSGVAKLQTLLASSKQDIANAIATAGAEDATIAPLRVASRLTDVAKKFAQQVNPQADLEAVSQVGQNFLDAHGGADLTLPEAQALKVGTYRVLRDKYGQMTAAGTESEKALARGLKEELEAHVPGISALNEREANLLQALGEVGRRAALSGNRDPIGFAWATHNPMTFMAALMDRSPAVKSLVARGLYNHAGQIAKVSPALIRAAVVAIASGDQPDASGAASTDPGGPR